ncbi:MAG TPA: beta-galactosidase, partial [Thermomicrobiales bacterium]|nr:beta-galactosidase [Thermomicrobiales bacterium]
MVELANKQILIDGVPRLLISGEIHYFRLDRDDWEDRILKLKETGANAVASYIPWLCHELEDGSFDLDGRTRAALDLGAFIDLVAKHDLSFIARPGPFIMAEMKNEGIPYRIYEEHPEILPVGWDGQPASTRTVDYLAPAFLAEARRWYEAVIPAIARRLQPDGGNVIAVQLDNEVGMLSWVSNGPDLTEHVIDDFWNWLGDRRGGYPFAAGDPARRYRAIRSPEPEWSARLMRDLGHYMRDRFARYIATLRAYAEEFGIHDVPFIVNIHGTEAGGGAPFPIGISQLYESYTQESGYIGASDHYLGNLTAGNAPDWYLMNALMEAVNRPGQPLASVEFEAGSGDYGQSMGSRLDPSALDFKLRMAIAQGNRLVNYYLFTGGINYRLDRETGDGNDRISFTGERHGTSAPVNPEGELNYTYPRLARAT